MRVIKSILVVGVALAIVSVPAVAKDKAPQMTAMQIQSIQTKDFEGKKEEVFASVMSVLQDAGYRVENADLQTGLITGIGSSKGKLTLNLFTGFGKTKKSPIVTAYIEQIGPITRVRLNFVMAKVKSTVYGSQPQDEEPIMDPAVYQDAFEKIAQTLFVRQSMTVTAPAASPTSPGTSAIPVVPGK